MNDAIADLNRNLALYDHPTLVWEAAINEEMRRRGERMQA